MLDWLSLLKRIKDLPNQAALLKDASAVLRSRLNFQGTVMGFSTEKMDDLWWLMVSVDLNSVRMT